MLSSSAANQSSRQIIVEAIHHLDHVLPAQAPIHDFVHHNTLHGFQHLPFEQALATFTELTGIRCYLPHTEFRAFYQQGRITDADLDAALAQLSGDSISQAIADSGACRITLRQLYQVALLHDLTALTPAQLDWQVREVGILAEADAHDLWQALLAKLELLMPELHPEDLLDLSAEHAEQWLSAAAAVGIEQQMQDHADAELRQLFNEVGDSLTLRGLLKALTGKDILNDVRPQLIRLCASLLDEGMAPWRLGLIQEPSLYRIWRQNIDYDMQPFFHELGDWQSVLQELPEDAIDAIRQQLEALAIPIDRWPGYLQRLALELPGWSGLLNWRQTHPAYATDGHAQPLLADYLAIRLVLDRLHLRPLCRKLWHCDARFDKLQSYFQKNRAEFSVRQALFAGRLPEYLVQAVYALPAENAGNKAAWHTLAARVWTWRQSPLARQSGHLSVHDQGWRLFQICRSLALTPGQLANLSKAELLNWLDLLAAFDATQRSQVWLNAYEHHYRQELLQALHANHQRGRWATRDVRPEAQVFFCMDEREESFRRHLEELNPAIETLGAAGFFGVAMNYKGLDDHHQTPLCPVVVTPSHLVEEVAAAGHERRLTPHRRGLQRAEQLSYWLYQSLRSNLGWAYLLTLVLAPLKLWRLLAKSLLPDWQRRIESRWQAATVPDVPTQLRFITAETRTPTPEKPKSGFSDEEQAARVAQFLRTTGLTYGFGGIVAILGHGSTSQNNPHEAAHDCGACGGRRGGPNARLFAAMANRPVVRELLAVQGIVIPDDTWFVGAQHDTCSDLISWYDVALIPAARRPAFERLQATLAEADRLAATERCRRFASSGYPRLPSAAFRHVTNRAADLSQVRPEFGHATNAAALIGRRAATQGVFFDRRLFLISYDPTQDADGTILENILLTAGPVGAGINLEYYFSTVNNDRLGCGTKIPHNVTGLFGVMEGAGSDLRTGLPLQMVEIHEAMRLQIVVEAKTGVLEQIYARQPALQELIGGGWVHLTSLDPDTGEIHVFQRGQGFVAWRTTNIPLPVRENSAACYQGQTQAVSPLLIQQPDFAGAS